jgi:hypothetical protein
MEADPSLPGWGGRSAPPPSAGGGRARHPSRMKIVVLRLAKRRRSSHVRNTHGVNMCLMFNRSLVSRLVPLLLVTNVCFFFVTPIGNKQFKPYKIDVLDES